MANFTTKKNQRKIVMMYRIVQSTTTLWPYHRKCTLHRQPPEQQEAMTNNFKYHSPEYRAIKTHTSLQQSEHAITCQQC